MTKKRRKMYIEFVKFRVRNPSHFSGLVSPFGFQDLASELVKTYKIDNKEVNQALELKLSKSTRVYLMDKVSNSPFTLVRFFLDDASCYWTSVSKSSIFGKPHWPQMGLVCRQSVILTRKRRSCTNYQHSPWQKWVHHPCSISLVQTWNKEWHQRYARAQIPISVWKVFRDDHGGTCRTDCCSHSRTASKRSGWSNTDWCPARCSWRSCEISAWRGTRPIGQSEREKSKGKYGSC